VNAKEISTLAALAEEAILSKLTEAPPNTKVHVLATIRDGRVDVRISEKPLEPEGTAFSVVIDPDEPYPTIKRKVHEQLCAQIVEVEWRIRKECRAVRP